MMSYLTRPAKVLGNNINDKKISNTEARTPLKKGGSDTKPTPENNKILKYIDDHNIVYGDKKATKADAEAAAKRIDLYKNQMSYQDQYNTYFNKKSPKYYKADKPKSNGKYIKNPSSPMDSFDWDLWLRDNDQFYETLEEEMKKTEIDKGLYEKYLELLKAGELLPNTTFEMFEKSHADFDTDIISKINKIAEDKKKTEGIASILKLSSGKI